MRLFRRKKRKSRRERLLKAVNDSLVVPIATRLRRPSDKTVKVGAIAAGGLTGLTAGSAGVSSLRRRIEKEEDDS